MPITRRGWTKTLDAALIYDNGADIRDAIQHGARISVERGHDILVSRMRARDFETAETLLANGVKFMPDDMFHAVFAHNWDAVKFMFEHGFQPDLRSKELIEERIGDLEATDRRSGVGMSLERTGELKKLQALEDQITGADVTRVITALEHKAE